MWVSFGFYFIFMLSNFYGLDLHNETSVALANLQRTINKYQIES